MIWAVLWKACSTLFLACLGTSFGGLELGEEDVQLDRDTVCKLFLYLFNFEFSTVPMIRSVVEWGWLYSFLLILSLSIIVLQKLATYHYGTFVSVHC